MHSSARLHIGDLECQATGEPLENGSAGRRSVVPILPRLGFLGVHAPSLRAGAVDLPLVSTCKQTVFMKIALQNVHGGTKASPRICVVCSRNADAESVQISTRITPAQNEQKHN
jgi:hypothetical protein